MVFEQYSEPALWTAATVGVVQEVLARSSGVIHIALAGGRTLRSHCEALAASPLALERLELWQVDERMVPRSDLRSNRGMIERAIGPALSRLTAWHPFDTQLPPDEVCRTYEKLLLGHTHAFDLTILGIGPDGHIASLFPGSPALFETRHPVAQTTTAEVDVRERVTLTFPPILASRTILLLAGPEKFGVVGELLHGERTVFEFPAAALRRHPDLRIHLLDY